MTNLEYKIINELKTNRRGKERAIHFRRLAIDFELNERELRDIIAHLITDYQLPIGSGQEGYYWISNDDEFAQASNELLCRIRKLSRRHKGLRLGHMKSKQVIIKQLQLI